MKWMAAMLVAIGILLQAGTASALTVAELEKLARSGVEDSTIETVLAAAPERVLMTPQDWIRLSKAGASPRVLRLLANGYSRQDHGITVDDIIALREGGVEADLINMLIVAESRSQLEQETRELPSHRILVQNKTRNTLYATWEENRSILRVSEREADNAEQFPAYDICYLEAPEEAFLLLWSDSGEIATLPNMTFGNARLVFGESVHGAERSVWLKAQRGEHELAAARLLTEDTSKAARKDSDKVFNVFDDYEDPTGRNLTGGYDPDHELIRWVNQRLADAPRTWRHKYYDAYFPIRPRRPLVDPYRQNPSFWTYDSSTGKAVYYYERNGALGGESSYIPYDWAWGSTVPSLTPNAYHTARPTIPLVIEKQD